MPLPPDKSLNDVLLRVREINSNPNVRTITQLVLKDGPQAFRLATLLEIINPENQEFHHYSLKIDQIERSQKKGWFQKPERSIRLEGDSPNELERLFTFLKGIDEGAIAAARGKVHLVRAEDYAKLERLLDALPQLAASDKVQLIRTILDQFDASPTLASDFVSAFEQSPRGVLEHIAIASRYVEYRKEYDILVRLVNGPSTPEKEFQNHLAKNPWMFGSEYSELLSRRRVTRDDNLDYMLRRTVDGFLEIIEIKTAFSEALFIYDKSHDCYYPSSQLTPVIGQVIRYVEEVERDRDSIIAKDKVDPLKIRARIIVGRDGNTDQQATLCKLNAHLHGIEVWTFDQLLRVARRVLQVFENTTAFPQVIPRTGEPEQTL